MNTLVEPLLLTLGEVSNGPPEPVLRAVAMALADGSARYTPPAGLPAVRKAVATSLAVTPGSVVMTTGASGGYLAFLTRHAHRGGNILIPDPGYPAYGSLARRLGIQPRYYPLTEDGVFPAHLVKLLDARTIGLVAVSPGNPTGRSVAPAAVLATAELVASAGVPILVDEVYQDLTTHPRVDLNALWTASPGSVVLRSYSKSFALSGLRIGALIAREDRTDELAAAHFAAVMSAPAPGQLAVLACLTNGCAEYLGQVRKRLRERARAADTALGSVPGCRVESGDLGVFSWLRVGSGAAVTDSLWRRHRIAVSPGTQFGPSGAQYIRALVDIEPDSLTRLTDALRAEVGVADAIG